MSSGSTIESLVGLKCELCGKTTSLSRAHICSPLVYPERNAFVLCGRKNLFGTCHSKYDHDTVGILCVDVEIATPVASASSVPQQQAERKAARRWFSFDACDGVAVEIDPPASNPLRALVNTRAELLLRKFGRSEDVRRNVQRLLDQGWMDAKSERIQSWLKMTATPEGAVPEST
jgi:hypothetical protein